MSGNASNQFGSAQTIDVHSLGQFEFCPRAGIIAVERNEEKPESDGFTFPNLSFTPSFDFEQLKAQYHETQKQLIGSGALAVAYALVLMAMGTVFGNSKWFYWLVEIPIIYYVVLRVQMFGKLLKDFDSHESAKPRKIEDGSRFVFEVNWWELVKAGYEIIEPAKHYYSSSLGLVGLPFRVLTASSRIPVIKSYSSKHQLSSSQRLRLAAYAELISSSEGSECNWGVVIFNDTKKGFAVPIESTDRRKVARCLREFRELIASVRQGHESPKTSPNSCTRCPLNRPRTYREGVTETVLDGRKLPAFLPDGAKSHCDCGDRFRWTPPQFAFEKKD